MQINEYEYTIKKSKFIGLLYDVQSEDEVKTILTNLKNEHKKARHFPFAYVIGPKQRKSDDKEPHDTAGSPIYNQLLVNKMDHHLLVIIRYFGGTKLGSGNLLRTYLLVAKNTIKKDL